MAHGSERRCKMIKILDFSKVQGNNLPYGGNAGLKKGFTWNGENWFLKFPKSTKGFRDMEISYTTSPLSEFIGSQIYEILEIPVHSTQLGVYENKVVVACKDFLQPGDRLYEFRELKNIYSEELDVFEETTQTSGFNTDINAVLKVIETNPVLKSTPGVTERFWDMFVVDAFIGNNDRNNGNWGLIYTLQGERKLSPVYDNGNSFRNKASDRQLLKTMGNEEAIQDSAYKIVHSIYVTENGRLINPFEFIDAGENEDCNKAVERIVSKIDLHKIISMIQEIPEKYNDIDIMSPVKKEYYSLMLRRRYEDKLLPALEKICEKDIVIDPMKQCMERTAARMPERKLDKKLDR